jgi:3-oxoadipate enol-lactonase
MVAQEVAVTRPERIERLVLLSTSPGGAFSSYPLEQLAELSAHERASRSLLLADRRWTDEWFTTHPEDLEVVMRLAAGQSAEETDEQRRGRLAQLAARQGHDVLDRLDRVTCPTYVACGRFDDIAPVANAEQIARRVPDTQLSVFDGGHLFMFQDPAAWPEILEFLARPAG